MSRSSDFFRTIPIDSPIHRLSAEAKVVAGVLVSIGLVFNTEWSHIAVAATLVVIAFRLARLPLAVLPRVPVLVQFALFGGLIGSVLSNEEPRIGAISLGGFSDYARLISIGFVMILWVGILAWTTGLTAVGFALRRLIRPLRFLRIPVDEIGTVIALAVRSLPLVAEEIDVVNESVTSRPAPADLTDKPFREAFAFIRDTSTAVVIGSHRRARDLSMAMVSRASTTAPVPPRADLQRADKAVIAGAVILAVAAFVVPGYPPNSPDPVPEIGGVVFDDVDGDGIRDDGEAGIAEVTVVLRPADDSLLELLTTTETTTSERGGYRFTDLVPGRYAIEFIAPDGATFSPRRQGDDDTVDSDPDPRTGRTEEIVLDANDVTADVENDIDAGVISPD